jgi:alcohol dehydrogenase class IV
MKENEQIITGENSISQIGSILDDFDVKKFMLVCGRSFDKQNFKQYFDVLTVPFVRFSGFGSNPLYEDVCRGADTFNKEECDCLVAVGGGSAIDVAKCIKLFCKMGEKRNYLIQEYTNTHIPLIAIPTTAGTGSESTKHAVIYFEGKKQSISHDSIVPEVAILDSLSLKGLPEYHKKCTMLDALCQGIESWWSVNSTDESIEYSYKAVELIAVNWQDYMCRDATAAERIMLAANLAGRAINITQTTAAHAMSYVLTSMYNLPHGHAVAVCLPFVWKYMIENLNKSIDPRGAKYLKGVLGQIAEAVGCDSVNCAIQWFEKLITELDIVTPETQNVADIEMLTSSVNPIRLKNNPVELSEEVLCKMYTSIVRITK